MTTSFFPHFILDSYADICSLVITALTLGLCDLHVYYITCYICHWWGEAWLILSIMLIVSS